MNEYTEQEKKFLEALDITPGPWYFSEGLDFTPIHQGDVNNSKLSDKQVCLIQHDYNNQRNDKNVITLSSRMFLWCFQVVKAIFEINKLYGYNQKEAELYDQGITLLKTITGKSIEVLCNIWEQCNE